MITKVYLKSQPKKAISYPDYYAFLEKAHYMHTNAGFVKVLILKLDYTTEANYEYESISRIEFRP